MLKFKKLNARTMMVFDIVGSFFVDCWYNTLYIKAFEIVKSSRGRTITDTYRYNITQYIRGINSDRQYVLKVIKMLHSYYQAAIGVNFISISEFVDKVLNEFIPDEYFKDFDTSNKDTIFHEIIVTTVVEFGKSILNKPVLERVIDDHENRDNVTELQDIIIGILAAQRDEYHMRFVRERFKPQERNGFDRDAFNKLKAAFIEEKRQKIALEEENNRLKEGVRRIAQQLIEAQNGESRNHTAPNSTTIPSATVAPLRPILRNPMAAPPQTTFFDSKDDINSFLELSLPTAQPTPRRQHYVVEEKPIKLPAKLPDVPKQPIITENAATESKPHDENKQENRTINKDFYERRLREQAAIYSDIDSATEPDQIEYDAETPW